MARAYVTGQILSISASAVNFHLQNAMRKLDVASKHQAVPQITSISASFEGRDLYRLPGSRLRF